LANKLLIILTTGAEDRGNRATLAFSMGVAALASGVETCIYLTMAGTFWSRVAAHDKIFIDGFEPLATYVRQFQEMNGRLQVCSPCNEFYCSIAKERPLMPGAELVGLTSVVDMALDASTVTL
jgi:uncharacterized protein